MGDQNQAPPKVRYDWYQTETQVTIDILCKNTKKSNVDVKFSACSLNVSLTLESGEKHDLNFNLLQEINPSESTFKVTPSKVEIILKKKEGNRWTALESHGAVMHRPMDYPTSSQKPKDWNKVIIEITNNENEKEEGEAALNALFQKIYSEGSDEVKKAMNKSFIESGGTVLSTNWGEVKRDTVPMKPPDGMEWKKWDS